MTTMTAVRIGIRPHRGAIVTGLLLCWLIGFTILRGHDTLALAAADVTSLHTRLNELNDTVGANRNSNPVFLYFFNEIRLVIDQLTTFISSLVSQPAYGRPAPLIGWLGVVALLGYGSWALGNLKVGLLAVVGFTFLGLQGLWQEGMDTFALTLAAVLVALLIGIPLGIWAGVSDRVNRVVTPLLDFMQTMPTFVYLAPLTLVFLIGPASAVIATLIYAAPPVIRITAHGIRRTPKETLEAAQSLGTTRFQALRQVMLPTAKRTIVIGINQTIMAALSMVTIAALIDAPGLGRVVLRSLQSLDVGTAFNAGLSIVVMAIVFDRVTTAASVRVERARRAQSSIPARVRTVALAVGGVATAVCLYLSYTFVWAAEFPADIDLGGPISRFASGVTDWAQLHLSALTGDFKELVTNQLLNPFQTLLTESPWWLLFAVLVGLAAVAGSVRTALSTALCLLLVVGSGLWFDAMTTLAATLVATAAVMVLGLVFGVWMGRSARADRLIRPMLDAAQTMPSFVYLVPFVALFAASRFTGIAAAVVYAAPVAIKIIADGIAAVSPTTMEAATSAGSSPWQIITKVQLPMSLGSLALAMNQGLIYVLSMVVVGGLVGGGALGYDVVAGFRQNALFGKGLAAGLAIVLLGIMLDRITQSVARRAQATTDHLHH
jgi:glycine betaine/proline transport system permease protein